jgi:hypothetical protein
VLKIEWLEERFVMAYRFAGPRIITQGMEFGSSFGGWFCKNLQRVSCCGLSAVWQSVLQ